MGVEEDQPIGMSQRRSEMIFQKSSSEVNLVLVCGWRLPTSSRQRFVW